MLTLTEDIQTKNFGIVAKMILGQPRSPRKTYHAAGLPTSRSRWSLHL